MLVKRLYAVIKIALCVFVVMLSAFVDFIAVVSGELGLLLIFVVLEILMLVYSFLLFRYIDKIILSMRESDGYVIVETFGSVYRTRLKRIQIIKGKWNFYYVKFDSNKLRVYPSNKEADKFIKKYFVRIKAS